MNDRFRFRAWNGKRLIYHIQIKEGLPYYFVDALDMAGHGYYSEIKNAVIMQSTGLRDKNGVLIFEGDVVKFRDHPKPYRIAVIKWLVNESRFFFSAPDEIYPLRITNSVIIDKLGNKYENPELLEQ
jgi:hypothetical protein